MSSSRRRVVLKFGGSSVATVEKLKAVAAQIIARRQSGWDVVVVVSAMGDSTDHLLAQAQAVSGEPPRRELDMLLSVGERISMALLAMAIRDAGLDAVSLTGSQSGIITTASHAQARIMEVRPFRVEDELDAGRVVIVAGYQGVSYTREITTLGRGGSDTTAVALAAALSAEACEIYSDVDGVYSADPRVVPAAQRLNRLGHEEMQELAEAGAKVLNAQAVEFAKAAGIAIYARKTGSDAPGTVVRTNAPLPSTGVRGLAHQRRLLCASAGDVDLRSARGPPRDPRRAQDRATGVAARTPRRKTRTASLHGRARRSPRPGGRPGGDRAPPRPGPRAFGPRRARARGRGHWPPPRPPRRSHGRGRRRDGGLHLELPHQPPGAGGHRRSGRSSASRRDGLDAPIPV